MPEEQKKKFDNKPIIETRVSVSKDGKWLIHKTTITDIKAVSYYKKVLGNKEITKPEPIPEEQIK